MEGDEPADAPPRLNHGSKVLPVKKKKSKSAINRMKEPFFYIIDPAFARFICQAFVPPQVDDPLNLAGVYSFPSENSTRVTYHE